MIGPTGPGSTPVRGLGGMAGRRAVMPAEMSRLSDTITRGLVIDVLCAADRTGTRHE